MMTSLASELEINQEDATQNMLDINFRQNPIRFGFNTIGYNGKYWLAGSVDVVRTKILITYQEVENLLNAYYDYSTFIKVLNGYASYLEYLTNIPGPHENFEPSIQYLRGRASSAEILKKTTLSQVVATYNLLKDTRRITIDGVSRRYGLIQSTFNTLHTIAKSTDGSSWKLIEFNPFQPEIRATSDFSVDFSKAGRVNGIIWNSTLSLWIAVGGRGYDKWNKTKYGDSFSRTNALTQISTFDYNGYNNGRFTYTDSTGDYLYTFEGKDPTIIATSSDGEEWKQYSISSHDSSNPVFANAVASSSNLTIVVGKNFGGTSTGNSLLAGTVVKSTDCVTWVPVKLQNVPSSLSGVGMTEGRGVAYNGNLWVVVGKGYPGSELTTSIFTSTDASTWTHRSIPSITPYEFYLNCVAWNGSIWLAVGTLRSVYISEDGGYTWDVLDKPFFNNLISETESSSYDFKSVVWDGNFWLIVGPQGTYRSQDTIVWEKIFPTGGSSMCSTIPLPILGGTLLETNSILVGQGSPASIIRSADNLKWYPQIFDISKTNYLGKRQKEFFDILWTGNYWILVGDPDEGNFHNNIARSSNGTDWTFPNNYLTKCKAISRKSTTIVVVGERSNIGQDIDAYSTDQGSSWTSGNLKSSLGNAYCVANNGTIWVAGGNPGIATSTDGSNWTRVNLCPLNEVNSIAWNGYIWVATGVGKSHSIALSTNGTYWYTPNPKTNPFKRGTGVAWNKKQWIAVGESDTDTIATSVDGYTWTGLGNKTFGFSGNTIAWTGTNWIASGVGQYSVATSTDGLTWERYDPPITKINKFVNKTITLPYIGVDNQSILTVVNSGSSLITNSTNSTIAAEEAAIKLAADQVAAAAAAAQEAATRLSSKNTAANYRIKFLFWKKKLNEQVTQLKSKTYGVEIETEYPVEFILAHSIYEKLELYTTQGQFYYEKIADPTSSLEIVASNLQVLESFNSSLTADLLQFYNNSRYLFKQFITAKYDKYITNSNTLTMIDSYNYPNNNILNDFNSEKNSIDTSRSSANTILDTEVTDIDYSIDIGPTYLYNKDVMDTVTVNGTTATIYSHITTAVPNLYSTYTSVDFSLVVYINTVLNINNKYKIEADNYVSYTLEIAQKWASVTGGSVPTTEINAAFDILYTKYFYVTSLPYYYEAWTGIGGYVNATSRSIKYFKIICEDYSHPSQYDTELATLYSTLKAKLDSIETTRLTAINYARNLRNTTVKNKLTEFLTTTKTNYTLQLGIDTHVQTLCNLTYYSDSNYIRAYNFSKLVKVASKVYSQLYPFIRAIKFADAEAEDDGCVPPSTGWGSNLNDLPANQKGKQGLSGWGKFNETYYARQRLVDHIRSHNVNGFVSYIIDNETVGEDISWKDFLNFTETFTYEKLENSIDDITQTVDTIESNSVFSESNMTSIANQDISDIQSQVIPTVTSYLSNLLTTTTEKLPSENDTTSFGNVSINGSATLSAMVLSINTSYDDLTSVATQSLTGKTNNEIQTILENAVAYKNTINAIQTSEVYLAILSGINVYKFNFQRASNHIELMEEQIARWTNMKAAAIKNAPFIITDISDGSGNPFIAGISPEDSIYWTRRNYTTFYNIETQTYEECTFNEETDKIETLPALDITKYSQYSPTTSYNRYDLVSYNGKIYECIKDVSSEYLEKALLNLSKFDDPSALFIQGIAPNDTARWKRRRYPYITFNGDKVEADPSIIKPLTITDYEPYTPSYSYYNGNIIRSADKIYMCINDIVSTSKVKGVLPTNINYWKELAYQLVVYNNAEIEASSTNLPALSLSNYDEYSITKTYYKGDFVKQNSKIYELVEYTTTDSVGKAVLSSTGVSPTTNTNSRWVERTYPVVYLNGTKIEATPGTFSALNINSYSSYSDNDYYYVGNYVTYNNKIYLCTLKNRNSLINIPVSNTEYWKQITFPTVVYDGVLTELIPGAIQPLNVSNFDSYRTVKRYFYGDVVSYVGLLYECISSVPYGLGVVNVLPTIPKYWKERKYPYVISDLTEIEADPDSGNFVQLDHLNFHRYEKGFLYYIGDMTSYNGNVYECTNVTPPVIQNTSITNISPTNGTYWSKLDYTLETTYGIVHWYPTISYEVATIVSYNGKIYICESKSLNNSPSSLGIYWKEITNYSTLQTVVPPIYSGSYVYGIGSLVSYRETATDLPNNETHKLNIYFCFSTQQNRPEQYTYDKAFTTGEIDDNGDYTTKIQTGNWLKDVPKYGLPEDDPFTTQMFAYKLRRRVAMEIELPYGGLKYNVFSFDSRVKGYFKNLLTEVDVIPSNAVTLYNSLEDRGTVVCQSFNTLESSPNLNVYNVVSKAYQQIIDYLNITKIKLAQYANKINTIKTQYFYNPGVQTKIYENPYKFMNPVGYTKSPPQKMFRDLGVGDIKEMESEVYSGNQLNYTTESIKVYYASTNLIDTIQEEMGKLLLQAKCITGYNILFKVKQSNTKLGARFPCLIEGWDNNYPNENMVYPEGYGPYVNIDLQITEYDIFGKWAESQNMNGSITVPKSNTIIRLINDIMEISVSPPEYCIGPSPLLESLTFESSNAGIKALGSIAKGLVGLTAAGFRNFTDPWQVFGAIEFIGQVVTNDYQTKILTFIPEGKWPSFNERSQDIRAFKQLINIERKKVTESKEDVYDETALAQFLETVGKLLRLNQYDLDDLAVIDKPDYVVDKRTVTETVRVPEPPNRPVDYVPPDEPDPPELKTKQSRANLIAEREQLKSMQRNLDKRLRSLKGGLPLESKYYVPIPKAVMEEVKTVTAGKQSKWVIKDMDAAGAGLRGTSQVKVSKSGTWNGAANKNIPVQQSPSDIPVNQNAIDEAEALRKTRRAEFKQAYEEAKLKQAQRKILIAQIEDARLREVKMTSVIEEIDFKNAIIEAENDALVKTYRKDLIDHQEYLESLRDKRALAEERYKSALKEYDQKIKKLPTSSTELVDKLNETKVKWTQVVADYVDGESVLVIRRTTYETRLMTRPPMRSLLIKMMPANLIAQYDNIINSATSLIDDTAKRLRNIFNQAVAPAASAAREAMSFLDNRPKLKPFAKFLRILDAGKPKLIAALGPLLEVAGIGVQAWQDGAFEESETLDS